MARNLFILSIVYIYVYTFSASFCTAHCALDLARGHAPRKCPWPQTFFFCPLYNVFLHIFLQLFVRRIVPWIWVGIVHHESVHGPKPFYFVHCMCVYIFLHLFVRRIVP